uniref:Ty3 transposon capsid-like protein domain-containing protein n=1 Tax=Tanacetum cinerariifolium TaxID=118510 RepID=A0A6L2K0F4_TANCI|nr:hypothetical protein [Tanacetum cinerariifolium]
MTAPPSPNYVFNFFVDEPHDFDDSDLEFEDDPQEEFEEDPHEDPEDGSSWGHWGEAINVLAFYGKSQPPKPSLLPRRLKRRAVERMVQKRVAEAIAEYERNQTNPENVGGGVVRLTRWFEKMEQVFEINKCAEEDKVKFTAWTFEEQELWTMIVKGNDIEEYNNRFHELALMCPNLLTPEKKKIKHYIRGLPEKIKVNVISSKPASLHDAIDMARELIEHAIQAKETRIGESNKRTWEDHQRDNNNRNNNTYHR